MAWWKKRPFSLFVPKVLGLVGLILSLFVAPVRADFSSTPMYGPPPLPIMVTNSLSDIIQQYALVIVWIIILVAAGIVTFILVRFHRNYRSSQQEKKP
jgi:multisubunit Na+/H+ antiporter MnhB subunit